MLRQCALAIAVLATLASTAQAVTYTPTRFDDPPPGLCLPADCSLREAVIAADGTVASDTIQLSAGQYMLTRTSGSEAQSFDLDVSKPLVIGGSSSGGTYIINDTGVVGPQARVFDVQGTTLSMRGVHLRKGNVGSGQGGCLRAQASMVAFSTGSAAQCTAQDGSGLAVFGGTLSLSGSSAYKNSGSAVAVFEGTLNLSSSTIYDNVGDRGGGIYVGGLATSFINAYGTSEVRSNVASLGGGIMVEWGANAEIVGPAGGWFTIEDNEATSGGGLLAGHGYVLLRNLAVVKNLSAVVGGGLSTASIDMQRVRVEGNSALRGGGAYVDCVGIVWPCKITESAFAQNVAIDAGGAIAHSGGGQLEITNVSSYDNDAARGGGIAAFGSVALTHVTSWMDQAAVGPSLIHIGTPGMVNGSHFRNSALLMGCATESGGQLFSDGGNAQLTSTPSCNLSEPSDKPPLTNAQVSATYGSYGGGMNVVGITAVSALLNSGLASWCKPTDVRGYLRPVVCDIGAFEVGATAP